MSKQTKHYIYWHHFVYTNFLFWLKAFESWHRIMMIGIHLYLSDTSVCVCHGIYHIYTHDPPPPRFGFSSPEGQLPSSRRFCQKHLSSVLWWNRQYIKGFSDLEKKIYIATEYNYFCLLLFLYYFKENLLDVLDSQMGNGTFSHVAIYFSLSFYL